jgi:O-antigen/teichoic acid export membrane protein
MGFEKIYGRLMTTASRTLRGEGLRAKAARGGAWLGSGSFAEQSTRFARNMLLARLLAPSAFGAMAIVLSSASLINSFSDVGVLPAIIQNPHGAKRSYLDVAWWLGMVRAVFMYAIVFAAAPWVARFYGNHDLTALLRVALVSMILDGMLSPRAKLAQKEMKFGHWAFISNGGGICGVVLTIALSFVLRDVWALAIGYCSENAFRCLFSYILYPGLPSLKWDKHAFRDLLGFSKGMVGLSFLNLLFARTDIFVLAKLHSPAALGVYALAVNLVQTPTSFMIKMLSQTMLPALSHVQSDMERMNRILSEVTSWVVLFGLPAIAMIWLCRTSLLTVFYGHRYGVAAAAAALALAAGVAFINTLNSMITSMFFAIGEPALHRRAVAASAIIMVIAIYPACKYLGLAGGQAAALVAITASFILQLVRIRDITGLNILRYAKSIVPAILASGGILLAGMGAHLLGLGTKPLVNIAIAASACVLAYVCCVPLFMRIRKLT